MVIVFILFLLIAGFLILPSQLFTQKAGLKSVEDSLTIRTEQLKQEFKFRSRELARRLKSEDLAQDEWQKLNDELEKDTAFSIGSTQIANQLQKTNPSKIIAFSLLTLVLVLTVVNYKITGSALAQQQMDLTETLNNNPDLISQLRTDAEEQNNREAVEKLYLGLRIMLDLNPNDANAWSELAFFNARFGRFDEAFEAIRKAVLLQPSNLDLQVEMAKILSSTQKKDDLTRSQAILTEVIKLSPEHQSARLFFGANAFLMENYQLAIDNWQVALDNSQPGSTSAAMIFKSINLAQQKLTGEPVVSSQHTPSTVIDDANTAAKTNTSTNTQTEASPGNIVLKVILGESITEKLSGNETLFIFAKAINGPRFPLAVIKTTAAMLGKEILISDVNAMQASSKISDYDQVKVTARLSFSGNAIAKSGDIQGETGTIQIPAAQELITVTLDKKL